MSFEFVAAELGYLMPEILLLTLACVVLLVDVYLPEQLRNLTYQLTQGTLIGAALMVIATYPDSRMVVMSGLYVNDAMAAILKLFILTIVFFAFIYSRDYLRDRGLLRGEFFVLGLFATLGMLVMVSAHSLLLVYLGLELLSLSLYGMVAMQRDSHQATEAAMKYFVLGAIASGMLLYGMSMLYGVTSSLDLNVIAQAINANTANKTMLVYGLVFIVIGLAFKLGAVPFHMWVPDVYQGAPTAVTLFISSAPKIAAFAILIRLLVEGLGSLQSHWQGMLVLLSFLSMGLGNIVAIAQSNIKRMLAYSTISHVGFLMLGVIAGSAKGYGAAMFYTIVYTLMSLGSFGILLLLSRVGFDAERLEDLKGLNERNGWFAFIMLILMLSMAGIPPLLGFWAKWVVLAEVIQAGYIWLAIFAVIFSVIGAFYYLRIIKLMYFDKPEDTTSITPQTDMQVALSTNGLFILLLGLVPQVLLNFCFSAMGV
ncbi:proton-translocating NADH-quinone oxidoreductase, chain N [Beggiatoa alba B18LD]|uniref:NADH-quinone oxidoreductase subunit N n=1 Tax=Beggiatoa alba B18LD TaxID=395493 RepID=I3CGM3_9GAMM|nr:NADH-quinone oxidoreductase subunit NuoN [Beggiatoa alba]EIJ42766.1 proton-translocating NADH-quinone oxidoreductase, chain N [Beggiatoa alba B18LD]